MWREWKSGSPMNIVVEEGAPIAQQVCDRASVSLNIFCWQLISQFWLSTTSILNYNYWCTVDVFQAFYQFEMNSNDVPMQIARRYCKNCTFLDPIAVSQHNLQTHRQQVETREWGWRGVGVLFLTQHKIECHIGWHVICCDVRIWFETLQSWCYWQD